MSVRNPIRVKQLDQSDLLDFLQENGIVVVSGSNSYFLYNTGSGASAGLIYTDGSDVGVGTETLSGHLTVKSDGDAKSAIVAQGNSASQSADIFVVENSAGTNLFSVASNSSVLINGSSSLGTCTIYGGSISDETLVLESKASTPGSQNIFLVKSFNTDSEFVVAKGATGVGIETPERRFHVRQDDAPPMLIERDQSGSDRGVLYLRQPDTTDGNALGFTYLSSTTGAGASTDTEFCKLKFHAITHDNATRAGAISFWTTSIGISERMRIDSAGAVIINGTSSLGTLTVKGNSASDEAVVIQPHASATGTQVVLDLQAPGGSGTILTATAAGSIGIGVIPTSALDIDVAGHSSTKHHLFLHDSDQGAVTTDWRPYNGSTTAFFRVQSTATNAFLMVPTTAGQTEMVVTGGSLDIYTDITFGVAISSSTPGISISGAKTTLNGLNTDSLGTLTVLGSSASDEAVVVQPHASATGTQAVFTVQAPGGSGTNLLDIDANGAIHLAAPSSAPADGEIEDESLVFWIDDSSDEIKAKGKTASSDVITITLGGGGGLSDIVDDTTPQLGANLDTNSFNILLDTAHGLFDDSSNEQLIFSKTTSAINHFQIANSAINTYPVFSAIGDDSNIGITLTPKGTGCVVLGASTTATPDANMPNGSASIFLDADTDQAKLKVSDSSGNKSTTAIPKVLYFNVADSGNVGAGEDDLHSYTIPADTFKDAGDHIEVKMSFTIASNSNVKTVKVYFGGTAIFDSSLSFGASMAYNNSDANEIYVTFEVCRDAADSQRISGIATTIDTENAYSGHTDASACPIVMDLAKTEGSTIILKATGEATSNDDIIHRYTKITRMCYA